MKVFVKIKDEKEVFEKIKKANELLKEVDKLLNSYSGLGRGIEVEIVPAQGDAQALEITCDLDN